MPIFHIFNNIAALSPKKNYTLALELGFYEDSEYISYIQDLIDTPNVQFLKNTIQHSDISAYQHVLCVSYMSYRYSKALGLNARAAARAGLLHDLVDYDWHDPDPSHRWHGYRHPGFALKNARTITELSPLEENIIYRHMWPLTPIPPRYKEAWLISFVDKYCAGKETMRKYHKSYKN